MVLRPFKILLVVTVLKQSVAFSVFQNKLNLVNASKQNVLERHHSQSNLEAQSLRVLVRESAPFTFQTSNGRYGGIEIQFVEAMAKKKNVIVNYISYNGSSSQLNDMEEYRDIDLIIGGHVFSLVHQFRGFSQTKPYYRDDITWCVQSAKPLPSWLKVFVVFKKLSVALILILLFINCVAVMYAFIAFDPKPMCIVETFTIGYSAMLGLSHTYNTTRTTTKMYMFFCAICSMLVSLHYLSFYTAFMISPKLASQMVSVNELNAKEFQLTGDLGTLSMMNKSGKFHRNNLYQHVICPDLDNCLQRLMTDNYLGVAVYRQRAMNNRAIHKSHLYCFDETQNIYTYFVTTYVNNSYFARDQIHVIGTIHKMDDE